MTAIKSFATLVSEAKQTITEIDSETVKARINDQQASDVPYYFVDIREESEWQRGSLPTAVHAARGVLEAKITSIVTEPDAEIILFCGGGSRSALAAQSLQTMGYTRVKSMRGGYRGWVEQGD